MKKLTFIKSAVPLLISLLCIQAAYADIRTDINGTVINLGDEGFVRGGGISVLWDMPRFFDNEKVFLYISSSFNKNANNYNITTETRRTYIPSSAGFEYRHQISDIPLSFTGSAGAGVSYFRREDPSETEPSLTRTDSDYGPYADLMVGLNYILSQNFAVFVKAGYQISFYNENSINSPKGYQFSMGLRIPVTGNYRSLGGIDKEWDDSEPIKIKTKPRKLAGSWEFNPCAFIPLGEFSEMAEPGPGGIISYMLNTRLNKGFTFGVEFGYLFIPGNVSYDKGGQTINQFHIAPAAVKAGYAFNFFRVISVTPSVSAGGAFINSNYILSDQITGKETDQSLSGVDPMAACSISIDYSITGSLVAGIKAGYRILFENDISPQFASCGINLGMRF